MKTKKTPAYKRPKTKHRYNWQPDLPDHRDLLFSERVMAPIKLPKQVDLRPHCSPIFNQGQIGSCTGNALAGAFEFLELKLANELFNKKFAAVSRLFIYYNERVIEGTVDQDAGARLRDGVKTLTKFGVCEEVLWKYSKLQIFKKPSDKAYLEAKSHVISTYFKINSLDEIKKCLSDGFPVAFGFTVFESFESPIVAKSGVMPIPQEGERVLGGHAVLAVGYDDSTNHLMVRNSWGTQWGLEGYFLMPYEIISGLNLAQDFWTLRS